MAIYSAGADVFARLASWLWATRICRNSAGNADVAIRRDDESHSASYVISSPAPRIVEMGGRAKSAADPRAQPSPPER